MAYGKYPFRDKSIRVHCKSNGKDGKWVLEDIIAVLFPTDWESRLAEKIELTSNGEIDSITSVLDDEATVETCLHIADPVTTIDFLDYCDDAQNIDPETYKELVNLIQRWNYFLDRGMALLGETHARIKDASEYTERTIEEGRANQLFTLKDWIADEFSIDLPWLVAPLLGILKGQMADSRRMSTGTSVTKNEDNNNVYLCKEFGELLPTVRDLIAGETVFNGHNYKDRVETYMNSKAPDECRRQLLQEEERVNSRDTRSKSKEEFIRELWGTSPTSSPNQYALLSQFVDVVRRRQNNSVRK
ncbi:MAG TPA: hypothetical protein DCE56_18620 [Cyanobacteria bacterium UBA8553]|nr:hypothetical protein [Cyanobacteria bacterium UBA8553]HAJ58378.1 hypothetical protein [Cyanobacteria bacterium UBA8543]